MIYCWIRHGWGNNSINVWCTLCVYPGIANNSIGPIAHVLWCFKKKEKKKKEKRCYLHVALLCWSAPWDVFELWTTLWVWNIWGHKMASENNCSIYDISIKSPRLKANVCYQNIFWGKRAKKHTLTAQILLQTLNGLFICCIDELNLFLVKNKSNE